MSDDISKDPSGTTANREIVAIFHSADAFAEAAGALQANGIDRARLSVLATGTEKQGVALRAAGFKSVRDVLDAPNVPRTSYTQPEDITTAKGTVVSTLIYVGATLGAGLAAAAAGPIIAGAIASGAVGGGIGAYLDHRFGGKHGRYLEQSLAHGGLVLWVHLNEGDDEQRIIDLLTKNGGQDARSQEAPQRDE